jgi:putative NADH-flavin reductase
MKITLFGASGRTGKNIIQQALDKGFEVYAYVRNPEKISLHHQNLKLIEGKLYETDKIDSAINGTDVVMSALGMVKGSPKDLMRKAAVIITESMKKNRIKRLIWQTGAGVMDENDGKSISRNIIRFIMSLFTGSMLKDSEGAYQIIKSSNLDWTVVRVPMLKDGEKEGGYTSSFTPPKPKPISRADVAEYMLKQCEDDNFIKKSPIIGYR